MDRRGFLKMAGLLPFVRLGKLSSPKPPPNAPTIASGAGSFGPGDWWTLSIDTNPITWAEDGQLRRASGPMTVTYETALPLDWKVGAHVLFTCPIGSGGAYRVSGRIAETSKAAGLYRYFLSPAAASFEKGPSVLT